MDTGLLMAVLNLAEVMGLLATGYLSDTVNVFLLLFISCFGSAVAIFTLWIPGSSLATLMAFTIAYGLLGGGFEALFPRFVTALTEDPGAELFFYGLMEFERGLGIIVAGPLSGAIMGLAKVSGGGEGGLYVGIGMFAGILFSVASIGGLGWFWRAVPEETEKLEYKIVQQID